MNALLCTTARALADRAVEIAVIAALTVAAIAVTWWFAPLTVLATAWWATAEIRCWRAHRTAQAPTSTTALDAAGVVSPPAERAPEAVSAGQQDAGRAGA